MQNSAPVVGQSAHLRDDLFSQHHRMLWNLAYRMLGSGAEADELVQETFLTALEQPPADLDRPLRPWLVRVLMNRCRDRLRVRKRQPYRGPWLPEPVPDALLDRREGAAYAMMMAMERLTPTQRAVWLLRDIFDYDIAETAEALTLTASNVKVTLSRARGALGALPPEEDIREVGELFSKFLGFLTTGDAAGAVALLTEDVVMLNDGAGRYEAAGIPVSGPERVVKALLGVARTGGSIGQFGLDMFNGQPMLWVRRTPRRPRESPAYLFWVTVKKGKIAGVYTLLAEEKLKALPQENGRAGIGLWKSGV